MDSITASKQKFFDDMAPQWDSCGKQEECEGQAEFVRRATEHSPAAILDAGCGTGVLVPHLRKLHPEAAITELDFSRAMLEVNKSKHSEENIDYVCGSIEDAPLPTASFDAILCFNALPHFNIKRALQHSAELLKPQGRLAIGHLMSSAELNGFHANVHGPVMHDHLPVAAEVSKMASNTGLTVLCAEERAGWYFILAEKIA